MKTREWFYIIFIVILIQFIVQAAAWLYSGNNGALAYISFAGTVVSIILAVLAIMYSFVQSSSQQQSSSTISNQVEKLIDVVDRIDVGKQSLSDTLVHLNSVSEKIDHTIKQHDEVKKEVKSLSGWFRRFVDSSTSYHTDNEQERNEPSLHIRPFEAGYNGILTMSIFMYFIEHNNLTINNAISGFIEPVMKKLVDNDDEYEKLLAYQEGSFTIMYQMLSAYDCLKISQTTGHFKLTDDFRAECKGFIEFVVEQEDDDLINAVIKECELQSRHIS